MQSGEICFLDEIRHSCNRQTVESRASSDRNSVIFTRGKGDYVRVTGHLTHFNPFERYCEIVDGSCSLLIDLSIADFNAQLMIGCCCQFIGELRDIREKVRPIYPSCELILSCTFRSSQLKHNDESSASVLTLLHQLFCKLLPLFFL